jgi:DNA-binding response OmpR family regulator
MNNFTISVFNNKTFFDIISKLKFFNKFKIKYYEKLGLNNVSVKVENQIYVIFNDSIQQVEIRNSLSNSLTDHLEVPFKILDFQKKIISLISKIEFQKNSLIKLNDYIIDKNERKIKKNNLELQLSEKEISFLILFSQTSVPIKKNLVLKSVWNYSSETETHTVETHIHRLRKKILEKFGDKNFIKNNNKGYFI